MYYIGLMSGTSMDAVDAALVHIDGDNLETIAYRQYAITKDIQDTVRRLDAQSSLDDVSRADQIMGQLFADAVIAIIDHAGLAAADINAIGSHGQTILHLPDDRYPRTVQIGNPDLIAERTGITTVAGFRGRDIAAGGQGAPLAPLFHQWYFLSPGRDRVILNIGGMANITWLPGDGKKDTLGFDTGPGNALLDAWTQENLGQDFDRDGNWAMSGRVDAGLLELLLDDPYFSRKPPKSTGRDHFNLHWLRDRLAGTGRDLEREDVQATLLALSARTIAQAIAPLARQPEILVCGGGIHNTALLALLKEQLGDENIHSTASKGIDPDAVEAVCFAWLARRRLQQETGNLPAVTGANATRVLGAVYSAASD